MESLSVFVSEAEQIARPSLLLTEERSETGVIAYWRGTGPVRRHSLRSRPGDRHRITFDTKWLAQQAIRISGFLSVYDVDASWKRPLLVEVEDHQAAAMENLAIPDGMPLYGHESRSFPPFQAVCLYGGPSIHAWLQKHNLERWQYDELEGSNVAERYQAEYQARCPLYREDVSAVLGGWHSIWPDDDFYVPREMQLLLWTLRDAEPWIEVFRCGLNIVCRRRIT